MTQLEKEQSLIENIKNYKLFLIVCLAFFATLFFYQTTKLTYEQYEPALLMSGLIMLMITTGAKKIYNIPNYLFFKILNVLSVVCLIASLTFFIK